MAAVQQETEQPRRRALVVDDSRAQRLLLRVALARWGYDVTEAASADAALDLCRSTAFDIVLSDWVMPGLSGPEFCRAFRALPREGYGYFILLTSKSDKDEVAEGLDAGADDFLSKPVDPGELRARMQAGERLLSMQRELQDKNRLLGAALAELQGVYDTLDRDLIEARKLQQSLVRDRHHDFGPAAVSLLLRPSGHVGGDLVGYFPLSHRRLAFFSIDVSGHGVASAMMAARLAGMLSASAPDANIALVVGGDGPVDAWPPEIVAARLNRMVIEVMQVEQYFTCVYADADLATGRVALVQAGHPHPLLLSADGAVRLVGQGGLPIGLVPRGTWDRVNLQLAPGDRLLLMTDGLTECRDAAGRELGEDGLADLVRRNLPLRAEAFLDSLQWDLERFAGSADFADDVSAVLFDWRGSDQR
ncbi:PP2C family protein-serine/threonine phosphatase [Gemmobacter sp.]|uniref:PP2C family protein-serine/threonine phosphatase n=1 Tax=Gemmobacter sp. TaxID=1898957 RepID=UPI00391A34AA